MTADDWAEYRRRLALREQRRREVEDELAWTDVPGRVWWWDEWDDR